MLQVAVPWNLKPGSGREPFNHQIGPSVVVHAGHPRGSLSSDSLSYTVRILLSVCSLRQGISIM